MRAAVRRCGPATRDGLGWGFGGGEGRLCVYWQVSLVRVWGVGPGCGMVCGFGAGVVRRVCGRREWGLCLRHETSGGVCLLSGLGVVVPEGARGGRPGLCLLVLSLSWILCFRAFVLGGGGEVGPCGCPGQAGGGCSAIGRRRGTCKRSGGGQLRNEMRR